MKPFDHNEDADDREVDVDDDVIGIVPDDESDLEDKSIYHARNRPVEHRGHSSGPSIQHDLNDETRADHADESAGASMGEALHWALDALHQPAMAWADWLARDIDPAYPTAASLLCNPGITLGQVRQAKAVYKTMRIVGEKAADRRIGARMYAAAIAAGLVRHGKRISSQSDTALSRAFQSLLDDRRMPLPLRDLAGMGLCVLKDRSVGVRDQIEPRSKSA